MKRIALFFSFAVLASPAFAAEDLCTVKMSELNDSMLVIENLGSPLKEQVEEHKMQADNAKKMGDLEACATHATKALNLLKETGGEAS
ncbi:hypothetical protein SAMN05216206_3177 [Pseudomonas guineae]|mgnify:CR=1 FL=1|uniref:Uncharacterized protein n=1 Tax=Pseudomonas guineae TaxID=425504 RepID=A0A1I3M6G5_9PSED|nr:hypothetical protein [Pseudomonas guineae]SFI92325.1 hypothetical protein SAMN05216206_3177 [Pseudomonas guineae]|tara:strand:- start:3220 stop:3483 length:264 start_codon:yes stop_codon:yes gene_type:complete